MGIFIREGADPLSEQSLASLNQSVLIQAPSEASRVLRQELERYCAGNVNGRSFLIAGHRGAGKTTMVSAAIDTVLRQARSGTQPWLHPLPVFLHGPSLFSPKGSRVAATDLAEQAKEALVQVILGLHRSAVSAFVRGYRERLLDPDRVDGSEPAARQGALELAAQFEIEVLEDPSANRLHEFWQHADLVGSGALFAKPRVEDQGLRELVALNGLCNAHQRISGDLQAKDTIGREQKTEVLPSSLAKLRGIELAKPVAAMFAGTAVTTGGALGSHTLVGPALLGVLAAALTTVLFESGGQTTEKRGRQLDTVFIPDLTLKTLDRVLPTLLQRLRNAGLAPVLVIDELDKVRGLPDRLEAMIHFLKKLVAENVFTCFLTDRSYLEHLRINGRGAAYGLAYSYFSHPLLVAHRPKDFETYLGETLKPDAQPTVDTGDTLDQEVLTWVLRHRSQLHALALKREVAAIRGDDGRMTIPRGYVRSEVTYLIDVTLQFAIELRLRDPRMLGWQRQHPDMLQVLHDALYYLTRDWLEGGKIVRIDAAGEQTFFDKLTQRMNLDEVRPVFDAGGNAPSPFTDDDKELLFGVVKEIVTFLGVKSSLEDARTAWASLPDAAASAIPETPLPESVWNALLLGPEQSLLEEVAADGNAFKWRYWASGMLREAGNLFDRASERVPRILATEARLREALDTPEFESGAQKPAFALLAEDWRILPSTPAWSRVAKAIENINGAIASPTARSLASEDDCRSVIAFAEMLKANDLLLVQVLAQATMLSALTLPVVPAAPDVKPAPPDAQPIAPDPEALRRTLQVLAEGLRVSAPGVRIGPAMEKLRGQIEKELQLSLLAGVPAHKPSQVAGVAATRLKNVVRDSFTQGLELARRADAKRSATVTMAWVELLGRLVDAPRLDAIREADFSEILCALWHTGPMVVLPLDPATVTLAGWSKAALATLAFVSPTAPAPPAAGTTTPTPIFPATAVPTGVRVPRWVAYFALEQLGAGNLRADAQAGLLERLRAAPGASPPRVSGQKSDLEWLAEVQKGRPWRGTANQARVVVLFLNRIASACSGWSAKPNSGLVASLDVADADAARQLFAGLKGVSVLPAAEQPSTAPTPEQMEAICHAWAAGTETRPLWLWVGGRGTKSEHRLVAFDPQGPDDLLAHVPVAS
jgi:hypothetical protein